MRLRQGVRAGLVNGVLGGDDKEWLGQGSGLTLHRDLAFSHGLQQGTLGTRRGAVDFIRQQQLGENRARVKRETGVVAVVYRHAQDVCRQQVAGKLNPLPGQSQHVGQGVGQGGLAHTGKVLDQQVAAGDQAAQGEPDLRLLPQQDLADFRDRSFYQTLYLHQICPDMA